MHFRHLRHLRHLTHTKHLRGKHDQRDHGRRAAGGGVSAIRDTITSLDSEDQNTIIATTKNEQDRALAQRRSKHPNDASFLQELQQDIRSYTGKDSRLRRAERERKYVLAEAKRQGGNLSAFQQAQLRSAEKDILESITTIESYRSQFNETLSRIREDRKRIQREQRKAKTRKVSQDTQTPFESLDGFGLKGWRRQRPDTPPDYSAYDQATPGRPAWMEDQRWEPPANPDDIYFIEDRPRSFRTITQTPEGAQVTTILPSDVSSTARSMRDVEPTRLFPYDTKGRRLFDVRPEWNIDVWDAGEALFVDQNEGNDFWDQRPLSWRDTDIRIATSDYGVAGYKRMNGITRGAQSIQEAYLSQIPSRIRENIEERSDYIRIMDAAMRPAPATIFTRRGVGVNTFARMQQHLKVGDRFTDNSFTSTSINPVFNWKSKDNVPMVNVILTEGTPTLWTSDVALKEDENEVIVGRGVTYEVVSTDNERGWILRTIPPEGDYVPPELTPQ